MSGSNDFSASSVANLAALSRADIPQGRDLRDFRIERSRRDESHVHSGHPLSPDEIDEQIRSFFAKGLA